MYLGRYIIIAPGFGVYRLSSRSFPDREIKIDTDIASVVPETDYDNEYISYSCLRRVEDGAVIGNGSHVDPITEKINMGYPSRDALTLSLLAMDYEKDDYDTPRIAGYVGKEPYIGIVTKNSIKVERVTEPTIVATYEIQTPRGIDFQVEDAEQAASKAYRMEYEYPVAACSFVDGEIGVYND